MYFFFLPRRKFSAATNGTCDEELSEKAAAWDFVEHSQRSYCSCSRLVLSLQLNISLNRPQLKAAALLTYVHVNTSACHPLKTAGPISRQWLMSKYYLS